jgi:hypothetical protein
VTRKILCFWREAPAADRWAGDLGRPGAPTRVATGTALTLPGLPLPRFAAIDALWFENGQDSGGRDIDAGAGQPCDGASLHGAVVLPVEEVVARGADALATRWVEGGERYKMMSFGRRNPALTRAGFVERWRADAGRLGGDRIPDEVRGVAYVQDHPRAADPAFDAVNEVWFATLDGLRRGGGGVGPPPGAPPPQ